MSGRLKSWWPGVVVALAVGGCGTTTLNPVGGQYWLVRVRGNYASIYRYPKSDKPSPTAKAVDLGTTSAEEHAHLRAAAQTLNVPMSHIQNEVGA